MKRRIALGGAPDGTCSRESYYRRRGGSTFGGKRSEFYRFEALIAKVFAPKDGTGLNDATVITRNACGIAKQHRA